MLGHGSRLVLDEPSSTISAAIHRLVPPEYSERLIEAGGLITAERRLVTILFADVTGSTALGENLDPEDLMAIIEGAFEVMIEPVYRYEGTLASLLGDGLLAFFGAPISHEDDPERAIHTGLEIVTGAKKYAQKLEKERGIHDFSVRVGINTGLVAVGEVGSDLRVEYTAMGDAVNLAARMEQNAPVGGVLITHDTYRQVRGKFNVQSMEPLWVKGKSKPVQAYQVDSAKPPSLRVVIRGVEGVETPTVGRDLELLVLLNHFRDVLEDIETRVVTLEGESGIGKTRLLEEYQIMVDLHPARPYLFRGGGVSNSQLVPYSLWRDMFANYFGILESDRASVALEKFRHGTAGVIEPGSADLIGQFMGFDFSSSSAVSSLLGSPNFGELAKAYLVEFFGRLLTQNCVVFIFDDLQWVDDSSLELLCHFVQKLPEQAMLFICATRPEFYQRRPLWGEGLDSFTRMNLRPLSKRSSRELVAEILNKVNRVPELLRNLVVDGAGGNPYYMEELIKMLIEDGVIETGLERWLVHEERLVETQMPVSVRNILQVRMDRLPVKERIVLQRASIVGRTFWDSVVRELVKDTLKGEHVPDLIESLRKRELVYQREQSSFENALEYTFKHSMLRDVAYETLLYKHRRLYHGVVARWLRDHSAERLSEYQGLISMHYELAGEVEKAAKYLRLSAEEAFQVNAYQEAAAAFERALKLIPQDDTEQRLICLVGQGQALSRMSDFLSAIGCLQKALSQAVETASREVETIALIGLGNISWQQGDYDMAERYLKAGLESARAIRDFPNQALAARNMARIALVKGDYNRSAEMGEESCSIYNRLGDRHGKFDAHNELGIVAMRQGNFNTAWEYFEQNLIFAREIGDRFRQVKATVNLGILAMNMGKYSEARDYLENAMDLNKAIGHRRGDTIVNLNLGRIYIELEDFETAWGYLRLALQESLEIQLKPQLLLALTQVVKLFYQDQKFENAAELLGLVFFYSQDDRITEQQAEQIMAQLGGVLTEEEKEAALTRGQELNLDRVVEAIISRRSLEELLNSPGKIIT